LEVSIKDDGIGMASFRGTHPVRAAFGVRREGT
jgi:hypothetical protein